MSKQDDKPADAAFMSRLRVIIGSLMAITGIVILTLSFMMRIIEPSTTVLLSGLALFIGGLLLANSMKLIEFIQDIMLR